MLDALAPEWSEKTGLAIAEKLKLVGIDCLDIFPWSSLLSNGIDEKMFAQSFLLQPEFFLRVRPGKEQVVKVKLDKAGFEYREPVQHCLALPNTSKVDTIIRLNEEAVVQDYNSQRVGEFIRIGQTGAARRAKKIWDCCAASGGKSIMAFDLDPTINLTVSDIRESILANLKKRFVEAGIRKYNALHIDLSNPISPIPTYDSRLKIRDSPFDLIICDVPCTGSGTWSRTPEQLYYFEKNTIDEYVRLQRKIISNTIPHLQKDGYFLYITCSVFKKENEGQVDFIREKFGLEIKRMEVLEGYEMKADTLYAALLVKPS
jgi:16S rRNA (cytosine967-C5)-methyltransferase